MKLFGFKIEKINKDNSTLSAEESELLLNIDKSIIKVGSMMDSLGYEEGSGDIYDDIDDNYEMIYHCGNCTVRYVMENVSPSIEEYIEYLKSHDSKGCK